MQFDTAQLTSKQNYKLLSGLVIPRPIGWISTVSTDNIYNVAPYSFFNGVAGSPPHVMFASGWVNNEPKDSLRNILDTGEFVANLVDEATVEKMNLTATILPAEVDEFKFAELTAVPCEKIKVPRVKESKASFECQMVHTYDIKNDDGTMSYTMVVGKVIYMHVDDGILMDDYKINVNAYQPIGRLAGPQYARINDLFEIDRLPSQK
ncbi:MAG: flavin reductase family protein [Chloroflexota bacterium]